MKLRSIATLLVVAGAVSSVCAQQPAVEVLTRAATLDDEGNFRAAAELVQPLLASKAQKLDNAVIGVAFNIRGLAVQNLGNLDEARRSYESAIEILRGIPDQKIQYAAALDNLGSLEADSGQLRDAKALRIRAKALYESAGDHAGAARSASNLAIIALALANRKEARQFLADTHHQQSLVSHPDARDLAWISGVECLLDEAEGNFPAALDQINRAIDLWTQRYGSKYYVLGSAYSVRGRLDHALGYDSRAAEDLRHSLALLSENSQEDSKAYFSTEIAYAKVLRDSGMKGEASKLESDARAALERLRHQQCAGCTISAEGIR